ncbi:MAG: TMEM175 family protein [Terriglobales bacterium]
MIREAAHEKHVGWEENFRWRAGEITRLEGFSDAVFAFAVTLLVVSLEVPHTFDELLDAMRGFAAFGISFAMLAQVWFYHYRYFRRYGLQDTVTVILNALLLFVVLFYVYPLKFVFTMLVGQLTGGATVGGHTAIEAMIGPGDVPALMSIYGSGFAAVFGIFALLYWRAWARREQMQLNPTEELVTRQSLFESAGVAAIGLASVLLALTLPVKMAGVSGYAYFLIPVVASLGGTYYGRKIREANRSSRGQSAQ